MGKDRDRDRDRNRDRDRDDGEDRDKTNVLRPSSAGKVSQRVVNLSQNVTDQISVAREAATSEAMERNAMPVDRPLGVIKAAPLKIDEWSVESYDDHS